jgi:hypothetical protein
VRGRADYVKGLPQYEGKRERFEQARSAGLVYNDAGGRKKFIVTMNSRPVGAYSVIAERVEIHGEHLVLVHSGGKLASLFLMGAVEGLVQLEDPLDPTEV